MSFCSHICGVLLAQYCHCTVWQLGRAVSGAASRRWSARTRVQISQLPSAAASHCFSPYPFLYSRVRGRCQLDILLPAIFVFYLKYCSRDVAIQLSVVTSDPPSGLIQFSRGCQSKHSKLWVLITSNTRKRWSEACLRSITPRPSSVLLTLSVGLVV